MKKLSPEKIAEIRAFPDFTSNIEIVRKIGASADSVRKYRRQSQADAAKTVDPVQAAPIASPPNTALPLGKHELPLLPDPVPLNYDPFQIDTPGTWLVLSDIHLPYHDRTTLELAVDKARKENVVGVLLNGDLLDSHELSEHDKDPSAPRYVQEIEIAKAFLVWLRNRFPLARLVFKVGNHEERLERYILRGAPALWGLEGFNIQSLLKLEQQAVEFVSERRVVKLGRLNTIHGHEYKGGVASPVNPARGLYLKARSVVMCGHHHQTSEHHARNIEGKAEAAWSLGCCCYLHPFWLRLNNWNHGFAFVHLDSVGWFEVQNQRVLYGKIV